MPADEEIQKEFREEADFINELYGLHLQDHTTALNIGHIYEAMRKYKNLHRTNSDYATTSPKFPSFDEVDAKINDVCALMGSDDVELVYVTIKELGNFA